MKKIQLSLLLLTILSLSASLFAGGFALSGVGSRATSMGGAFRGLADDATAMYWNPAGLANLEENQIDLGGTFIMPSGTWDPTGTALTGVPGFSAKEFEAEKSLRSFPNLFVTMAKHPRLKYGLGVFVPYGLGTTWDLYKLPSNKTYLPGFPEKEFKSSISVIDIHPSVSYQLLPSLSAGLGLSVFQAKIELAKMSFSPKTDIYKPVSSILDGSGLGLGANLGFIFKPTSNISLGLSGKIPAKVSMEGEAEIYKWIPEVAATDTTAAIDADKYGGQVDIDTDLNLPADIGLGISYKVMPNWTVNLDYSYTMWSSMDSIFVKMKTPVPVLDVKSSTLYFNWKDTYRVSLGTEYTMCSNTFRAGAYFDQSPIPGQTQTPTLSDVGNKYSVNLGYGRVFGKLSLDVNAQYVIFSEREVTSLHEDYQGFPTNIAGVYNSNSISGNIGLGYRF